MRTIAFLSCVSAVSALHFLAIGDWGGQDAAPFFTQPQFDAAVGMNKVAQSTNAQFVVNVGDSFYDAGVTNVSDPRFQTTFEQVYSGNYLQIPWYTIAGNHDYDGNVTAQVEYTQVSQRWEFPALYHQHSFETEDHVTLDMIMIDTIQMASKSDKREFEEGYFDPLPLQSRHVASSQWDWLEELLSQSKADHIIVVGHYPVYSVCKHGPTQTLIDLLTPMLVKYGAHYLSGHDHCMEHFVEPNTTVNYFLTGMGMECCYAPKNKLKVPPGALKWYCAEDTQGSATAGFTSFEVNKSGLQSFFYDQTGAVIYSTDILPARSL